MRDDAENSDLLFQTADTTWQADNQYGGNSLYTSNSDVSARRAYKEMLTVNNNYPKFNSREAATNKPQLVVTLN